MPHCLLAVGSNLGDRRRRLHDAFSELADAPDTVLVGRSKPYETASIGGADQQPAFLNAAACIATQLSPSALLARLHDIEARLGRQRRELWAARTIDLDLLLYGDVVVNSDQLTLPHARMEYRRFVLQPACDAAPWMTHPTSGWTVNQLHKHLDQGADCIAVAAADVAVRDGLIERIVRVLGLKRSDWSHAGADVQDCRRSTPIVGPWRAEAFFSNASRAGVAGKALAGRLRPKLIIGLVSGEMVETVQDVVVESTSHSQGGPEFGAQGAGNQMVGWRKILELPATGPVAWIDCRDPDEAERFAVAAVQAVWTGLA